MIGDARVRIHPRHVLIALSLVVLVDLYLCASNSDLLHWVVIFPSVSGVVLLSYIFALVRKVDVLDPILFVSAFLLYQLFFNPLLQVYWDAYLNYDGRPRDMRDWLGYMSLLNTAGLIAFFIGVRKALNRALPPPKVWTLDRRKFYGYALIALVFGTAMYAVVLRTYGGIGGIVEAQNDRIGQGAANNPFKGEGLLTVLTEFVPQLAGLVLVVWASGRRATRSLWFVIVILVITLGLGLLYGGLRGSRQSVVFSLLSVGGAIHYCIYRFGVRHVIVGVVVIVVFMNIFFYYKRGGLEGLQSYNDVAAREHIEEKVGGYDSVSFTLLDDFGRADIQALALYRVSTSDVPLAWGRSYAAALVQVVPRSLWDARPEGFKKERTDLLYGVGAYDANPDNYVPWIFGMPGELMVNFGWAVVPLAFLLLGYGAGALHRRIRSWSQSGDARILLAVTLTSMLLMLFAADSHLYLRILLKSVAFSGAVIFLASRRSVEPA
jgi:hypothetical protein